jgi:hypothetical protein
MRSSTVFLIGAVIALVFGIGFVAMPAYVLSVYGVSGDVATVLMARFFGTALLQIAVTLWALKDTRDAATQRGLAMGGAIAGAVGLVVSLRGTMMGTLNTMGWSAVAIYAILLVLYLTALREPRASIA